MLSEIGAGTLNNPDGIDGYAGIVVHKKISDRVSKGEGVMDFCCSSEKKINNLIEGNYNLFEVSESECDAPCLIY